MIPINPTHVPRRAMRGCAWVAGLVTALTLTTGCDQQAQTVALPSLSTVGAASVVCLATDADGLYTVGRPLHECPDAEHREGDPEQRRIFSLVTQPDRGEVAVVDLSTTQGNQVIDFEPSQPGFSFLPIGAQPGALVSTPGGMATFASTLEVGREGIFALPSSCIQPGGSDAPVRDIRSWPACQLPSAPGPMVLLTDPSVDGLVRASCGGEYVQPSSLPRDAQQQASCPADLSRETTVLGRQKLAVALPELSEVWVLDAQQLLDRTPGTFDGCTPELRLKLSDEVVSETHLVPPSMQPAGLSCEQDRPVSRLSSEITDPYPVDFALDDRGRLYVADLAAPLIHVLDVSEPCSLRTLEPLQPQSYLNPGAAIPTRRVAATQRTAQGKHFVYAIDASQTATAGSIIPFDVSQDSETSAPLIRDRAQYSPSLPPDRIALSGRVADVEFVFLDNPLALTGQETDSSVSVRVQGIECQPDPVAFSRASPEASYRNGAGPRQLRGTFAYAAMEDGQMRVIDVEDLDALCRRPLLANPGDQEDLAGCRQDPDLPDNLFASRLTSSTGVELDSSVQTVTNELSCHVVTPHWPRSSTLFSKNNRVAVLSAFPSLTLETGRAVTSDQSEEGVNYPKMLGARHPLENEAVLSVGANDYRTGSEEAQSLDLDPGTADRNSLLFSYEAPRELIRESVAATYEGIIRTAQRGQISLDSQGREAFIAGGVNADYCSSGVRDMEAAYLRGQQLAVADADLEQFSRRHADYIQIVDPIREEEDEYWQTERGSQCGLELFQLERQSFSTGHDLCEQFFGPANLPGRERDFRIVAASESQLGFEPRSWDPTINSERRRRQTLEFVSCCFPDPALYRLRAGHQWLVRGEFTGSPHPMVTDPESLRCVADCSPLRSKLDNRVFELSCDENCPLNGSGTTAVGRAVAGLDTACIASDFSDGLDPDEPGAQCVFQNLTSRFAIYRGQQPSTRGMSFRWNVAGGFSAIASSIAGGLGESSPTSLFYLARPARFLVPDATAAGLTLYSPTSFETASIL